MTEEDADEAFAELLREVGDFITLLSAEIGIESKAIAAEHPGLHKCDPRGRPLLMPRLALLATFCEHPSTRTRPSRMVAADWEQRYLAIDEVTRSETDTYTSEARRRIVCVTFEALVKRLPPAGA